MNLISEVKAQETEAAAAESSQFSFTSFIPLILIFAVFYILIIRPQSKKIKEHQKLVDALKVGDKVITNSGIVGVVKGIHKEENMVDVEISEGVNVKMLRGYVAELVTKKEKEKEKKTNKKSKK